MSNIIATAQKNGYLCYHKGRQVEVYAATSFEAQQLAVEKLRLPPKKRCEVAVVLAVKAGEVVEQLRELTADY